MRLTILCFILLFSSVLDAKAQWRVVKNQDDIIVYSRNVKDLGKSLRGSMTVDGTLSSVLSIIEDINSYPRWLHNCYRSQEIKQTDTARNVNYVVLNMPWPVKDRDIAIESTRTQNKQNKRIEIKFRATSGIVKKVKGKIRITKMKGRWVLTPTKEGKVNINYEVNIKPGKNIPKWIVNALAVDLPFHTLRNLRKITKEDKYRVAKINGIIN